jgi:hypothetical protein
LHELRLNAGLRLKNPLAPWYIHTRVLAGGCMTLVVKLEDDLGERGEWVMLYGVIPGMEERDFPVLRGIDPFGKTVFNHLQAEVFLEEWERVKDRAKDESQREAWQKVKEMAESCKSDRDLYLRFVGH